MSTHIEQSLQYVISQLKGNIAYQMEQSPVGWVIDVTNRDIPNTLLQIEILSNEDGYNGCVLQKVNVGRRVMERFMNKFMNRLSLQPT